MSNHIKLLGWLHIILGSLGLLAAITVFAVFGGIATVIGFASHDSDAVAAIPIVGAVGAFVVLILTVLSLPGIIAGIGLLNLRPWARILTIVLSAFELLHFPFGTALGVYGFWVLLQPEAERLFGTS